jgi:RecA-family ATPase
MSTFDWLPPDFLQPGRAGSRDYLTIVHTKKPCGKHVALDGEGKALWLSHGDVIEGEGIIVHVPDADAMSALLRLLPPNHYLIPDFIPCAGQEPFEIMATWRLNMALGLPADNRPFGSQNLEGHALPVYAKLKENFTPGSWRLFDFDRDEHTPDALRSLQVHEAIARLEEALPGLKGCPQVVALSSKGRVLKGGEPLAASPNFHMWVQAADPDLTDQFRQRLLARLAAAGLGWMKPRSDKMGPAALIDSSVWAVSRCVYSGAPGVGEGLTLAPAEVLATEGYRFTLASLPPTSEAEHAAAKSVFGIEWHGGAGGSGGSFRDTTGQLTEDTILEVKGHKPMTLAVFMADDTFNPGVKYRCQTPFRASTSWNGILRKYEGGQATVYDHGSTVLYAWPDPLACFNVEDEPEGDGSDGGAGAGELTAGNSAKRSGLTAPAITEDEIARAQLTPTCIVENMLYADVGVVNAPGGVGKTTLTLYIAVCIRLGLDVFGERVVKRGPVLILTAEDSRQILVARLREIMAGMFLDAEQTQAVMDGVRIADVSGLGFKLTEVVKDMVLPYETNIDAVLELGREVQPVVVMVDPAVSFGVGESRVNDAEQGLIETGRRLRNELRCCVLYIHHTGKANAREKTLDQYTGRGGSSFADGSRMVLVMQNLTEGEFVKATGQKLEAGETGIVLARPKISFCPPQGEIYIKRTGYLFGMVKASARTPEQAAQFAAAKVYEFLENEYRQGRRYSTSDLESMTDKIGLPRQKIRASLTELKVTGRAIYHEVKGKSGSHWQPVTLAEDGGDT